jgi:hypothetical protein
MRNAPDYTGSVKLVIGNFTKVNSLYENGMQPSFFSRRACDKEGRGWYQAGQNIRYEESQYSKEINDMNYLSYSRQFMQLSFTFNFEYTADEIFCCYTIPYSYSDMQAHLNELRLLSRERELDFIKLSCIGKSIGGLSIPILRISTCDTVSNKPVIMIIGR